MALENAVSYIRPLFHPAAVPVMKLTGEAQRAFYLTLFLFGLLTWAYVVMVQMIYPKWMNEPLTHVNVFPLNVRVDETGIAGFIISALSFFLWQLTSTKEEKRKREQQT